MSSANKGPAGGALPVLSPIIQLGFYRRLIDARAQYLLPALLRQVASLDIGQLDAQLLQFVGNERLSHVAAHGIRAELIFPVPYLLEANPKLLGYYRLVLGFSQKEFYAGRAFGTFARMETQGVLAARLAEVLPSLCRSLIESAWLLIRELPQLSLDILDALTLVTLGAQWRGSYNTLLGQAATQQVFNLIRSLIGSSVQEQSATAMVVRNAAGREVRVEFAADPDIAIREQLASGRYRNRIAIEIKGGRDYSNIHNRLGEAEKSHQKAKKEGFTQFWTMVNVVGLDEQLARRESPSTTAFFRIDDILAAGSTAQMEFGDVLMAELGLRPSS